MSTRRNVLKLVAGAAVIGSVAGSFKVLAEVRAVAQTNPPATDRIALKGYDPVAYFTLSTPTPGVAEYDYVYDGVRYFFLMRKGETPFTFDVDLARKQTDENPVFYVQMAHARMSGIFRVAGIDVADAGGDATLDALPAPEDAEPRYAG